MPKTTPATKAVKSDDSDKSVKIPKLHPAFEPTAPADKVIIVHVNDVRINPALNIVPMMGAVAAHLLASTAGPARQAGAEMMAEKAAMWEAWDAAGEVDAVKAHLDPESDSYILDDGRHRLEWVLARGHETLRVETVTAEEGAKLAEATVIGRRHWTKGQKAYLGVLSHPEVAGGVKHGGNRKKKQDDSIVLIESGPALAERLGVCHDTVLDAIKLYILFHAPGHEPDSAKGIEAADLKAKYEMSIWAGAGLGGVLAGIGGGVATKGKPKPASGFHGLEAPLKTLTTLSKSWGKWDDKERGKAAKLITARLKELDPDFRLALSEALAAAE